ncbi:MAG: hypothetical protein R3C44_23870 [Chloroflexota bacterium]
MRGGPSARMSAELLPPRPGAAYLAVRNNVPVLPVAFLGGEKILENLRRGRRTSVMMTIGPVFGPLVIDASLPKQEQRRRLDDLGYDMMRHLAALLPLENQGFTETLMLPNPLKISYLCNQIGYFG